MTTMQTAARTILEESAVIKGTRYAILRLTDTYSLVSSKSRAGEWHPVKCGRCSCEWAQKSQSDRPCAHLLALQSLDLQAAIEQAESEAAKAELLVRNLREAAAELAAPVKTLAPVPLTDELMAAIHAEAAPPTKLHRLSAEAQASIL